MNHPWFKDISWTDIEQMKVEPAYKPPLTSEGDTQFFSKEFTESDILNPEDIKLGDQDGEELLLELMEGDLECLYSTKTADEAENNSGFDNFY